MVDSKAADLKLKEVQLEEKAITLDKEKEKCLMRV